MASRPQKTLADYLVLAVSPALIMLLVGSLVFFLLEVSYHGDFPDRMRWTLFWFVPASVLAARIGIEQGREHARVYSLALGIATSLVMLRYADSFLLAIVLLAVVWWCADKLTWDCTLIDDNEDASGSGLLDAIPAEQIENDPAVQERKHKRPHAPGRTVLYFSLAALPLFGIGQVLIPANQVAARTYAFRLLWIYLAAALGLLLSTSFLGLRRYLRQRRLEMPAVIVRSWIGTGTALVVLILVGCIFLPRPDADYSVLSVGKLVEKKVRDASRFAFLRSDPGKGQGRQMGESKEKGKQQLAPNKKAGEKGAGQAGEGNAKKSDEENAQKSNDGNNKSEKSSSGNSAGRDKSQSSDSSSQQKADEQARARSAEKSDDNPDKKAGAQRGERTENDAHANGQQQQPAQSKPSAPAQSLPDQLGNLAKWLFYAVFAIFVLWVLIRYWSQLLDAFVQLWAALLALFGGGREKPAAVREQASSEAPVSRPLPFAAFRSPFATGNADQMPVEHLVQYTFDALQAWANDRKLGRGPEQTPLEFSQALGARVPSLSKDIDETVQLYARVAYSGRKVPRSSLPVLEKMWRRMSAG